MTERDSGSRMADVGKERHNRTSLLIEDGEELRVSRQAGESKARELDQHLTNLGFPDGRPLRELHPERIQKSLRSGARMDTNQSGRPDRKDIAQGFNDELWELTHPTDENFTPTLEPDARDWSPFVIKSNYHGWARRLARQYGIEDHLPNQDGEQGQDLNAFRHAATAAVFALKYGPKTALLLGTINELITEPGAILQGHMNENEIADCNADLLNNRAGINIARKLLGNNCEKGQITLKDVTDEVVRELRNGMLVTKPVENLRNENIAPELKLLLGKPDGI